VANVSSIAAQVWCCIDSDAATASEPSAFKRNAGTLSSYTTGAQRSFASDPTSSFAQRASRSRKL
jgi:hypothetical protein